MDLSLVTGRPVLDAAAVDAPFGTLLVLDDAGALIGVDTGSRTQTVLCRVDLPPLPADEPGGFFPEPRHRLHAADDGSVAMVVVDAGTDGLVVETATGRTTLRIESEDDDAGTVEFAAAVVRHRGRQVVLHRTAWNRLDASDGLTGALLTGRGPTARESVDEPRPAHYLDYFHGPLAVSPGGLRVANGGWVWHPVGVVRTWSLTAWLEANPFESEDGPSACNLLCREDWNLPMVWLDDDHLAVTGLAGWNGEEFEETGGGPGVRVMDVRQPDRDGDRLLPMTSAPERLLSDGSVLVTVDAEGTTVRDPGSGDLRRHRPGLRATHLDPVRRELVEARGDRIVTQPL
jgi:hypothetical protein